MNKISLILLILMLLTALLPFASATGGGGGNLTVAKLNDKSPTGTVFVLGLNEFAPKGGAVTVAMDWRSLDFQVAGVNNFVTYRYVYAGYIGSSVSKVLANGTTNYAFGWEGFFIPETNITQAQISAGVARVTLLFTDAQWQKLMFEHKQYNIVIDAYRYWRNNNTIDTSWWGTDDSHTIYFEKAEAKDNSIFIGNAVPPHLTRNGGDALITNGFSFETSYSGSQNYESKASIFFFITDKTPNRNLLGWASYDSYLAIDQKNPIHFYMAGGFLNFQASTFKKLFYSVHTQTLRLAPSTGYHIYLGVKYPGFSDADTWITTDYTMKRRNFSVTYDAYGYTYKSCVREAWNLATPNQQEFMGVMLYIETFPSTGTKKGTVGGNVALMAPFILWCNDQPPYGAGLPWLPTVFGFLIPLIISLYIYKFAKKHEVSLPNYIYALPIIGGSYVSYVIGLFDLPTIVIIVASLVFIIIYRFREPINLAIKGVKGAKATLLPKTFGEKTLDFQAREAGWKRRLLTDPSTGTAREVWSPFSQKALDDMSFKASDTREKARQKEIATIEKMKTFGRKKKLINGGIINGEKKYE